MISGGKDSQEVAGRVIDHVHVSRLVFAEVVMDNVVAASTALSQAAPFFRIPQIRPLQRSPKRYTPCREGNAEPRYTWPPVTEHPSE